MKHHRFLNGNRIVTFPFRRGRSQRSDGASSLITEVEAGRGVVLALPMLKLVAGKRLLCRPLTGTSEVAAVGVAGATKGNVTPAGKKFCEVLRQTSISNEQERLAGGTEAASRVILKSAAHKLPAFLEERITYENHVHGAS